MRRPSGRRLNRCLDHWLGSAPSSLGSPPAAGICQAAPDPCSTPCPPRLCLTNRTERESSDQVRLPIISGNLTCKSSVVAPPDAGITVSATLIGAPPSAPPARRKAVNASLLPSGD